MRSNPVFQPILDVCELMYAEVDSNHLRICLVTKKKDNCKWQTFGENEFKKI